jgi:hypothetical protein
MNLAIALRRACALALASCLLTLLSSVPAQAQSEQEPNDTCATAQDLGPITLPFTLHGELDFEHASGRRLLPLRAARGRVRAH